jgi:hypothetical protein
MVQPETAQLEVCRRFGVQPMAPEPGELVGIARNIRSGLRPLQGMRYLPEGAYCGWLLWAGDEPGEDGGFFQPMHVGHLAEWAQDLVPYLALLPGWRFRTAPGYQDVWFDEVLLDLSEYE